jgi:hypothetical protein
VTLSPSETLPADDRGCLERVRVERRLRLVSPEADLDTFLAARGLDLLACEGPPGIYLFPRQAADGTLVIHAVNWSARADGKGPEVYRHVTISLRHPRQWPAIGRATYWQPGAADPAELTPEPHADALRITLPELATWGILALAPPPPP